MIRQPVNDEYLKVCSLLYQSGPRVFNYFFAGESEDEVCRYLHLIFDKADHAFSREFIWIEEHKGDIRGAILGLPGRDKHRLEKNIGRYGKEIFKLAGTWKSLKMMLNGRLGRYLSVIGEDEYYIGNLTVEKQHRGLGIGPALLGKIREVALAHNYRRLSLLVAADNEHARHVYEKFGFATVSRIDLPRKYHRFGISSFYKVIKDI